MHATARVRLDEHDLVLLPQRAVIVDGPQRLLVLADLHLGKDAAHRAYGVRVPHGTTTVDLARLSGLVTAHQPDAVWVLGDLIHHTLGMMPDTVDAFAAWRSVHALPVHLVPGNHDRPALGWPVSWDLQIQPQHAIVGGLQFCHAPHDVLPEAGVALCGHVHPAVVLRSRADRLQVPCFWWTGHTLHLPAFSGFTGGARVRPRRADSCWAIVEDRVVALGASSA